MNVSLKCALFLFICLTYDCLKASDLDDVLIELYEQYKEAVADENNTISTRRVFKQNKQYEIHVQKLKEVNGLKYHNLVLKEKLRNDPSEYIYISNPLESKISKAFLTLDEFKQELLNRIERQRLTTKTTTAKTMVHSLSKIKVNQQNHTHPHRHKIPTSKKRSKIKSTMSFKAGKRGRDSKTKTSNKRGLNKRNEIKSNDNTSQNSLGKNNSIKTDLKNKTITKKLLFKSKSSTIRSTLESSQKRTMLTTMPKVPREKFRLGHATTQHIIISHVTLKYFNNYSKTKMLVTSKEILESNKPVTQTLTTLKRMLITENSTTKSLLNTPNISSTESIFVNITTKDVTTKPVPINSTKENFTTPRNIFERESFSALSVRNNSEIGLLSPKEILRNESMFINPTTETTTNVATNKVPMTETSIIRHEMSRIETKFENKTTEKITKTYIAPISQSNNNLGIKPLNTSEDTLRSDTSFENVSITPEIFGSKPSLEETTYILTATDLPSNHGIFGDSIMKLFTTAKRTPRRKKRVRFTNKTINTTKYKRLGRPLVYMGGYGQPVNKYVGDVNVIKF